MNKTLLSFVFAAAALICAGGRQPAAECPVYRSGRSASGCYGEKEVLRPNTSLLTGRRPDTLGPNVRLSVIRKRHPNLITLPQLFKTHGYHTQSFGKIFHGSFETAYVGRSFDDPASWSVPGWFSSPQYYFSPEGMDVARQVYARNPMAGDTPDR